MANKRALSDDQPFIDSNLLPPQEIEAGTHLPDGMPLLGRPAMYLIRDPRDVAAHSRVRQRIDDWSGHVRAWLDQTDIRRDDTAGVFRELQRQEAMSL